MYSRDRMALLCGLSIWMGAALAAPAHEELAESLRRCRAMADKEQRLACYDALTPAAWGLPSAASVANPGADAARFGLPAVSAQDSLSVIEAQIPGRFMGWGPRTRIRLSNGQVWEVADGSEGAYEQQSPKVKIRRGMLGSFFLDIEGVTQTPKVRRIQ